MLKIGAHVSIAGGIDKAPARAREMGGNSLQIFSSSPQRWKGPDRDDEIERFKEEVKKNDIEEVFIHAKYLISLGNKKKSIRGKSIRSLKQDLILADKIGARGVIFHPRGEFERMMDSIKEVVESSPSTLIVENTAQSDIEETAKIFQGVDLGFCLDTAHAFEAGHDISTPDGVELLISQVDKGIGLENLLVVHINDSLTKMGSHHDRHADIGQGEIGQDSFRTLMKKLKNLPFILEVPGLKEGRGGENISLLLNNLT